MATSPASFFLFASVYGTSQLYFLMMATRAWQFLLLLVATGVSVSGQLEDVWSGFVNVRGGALDFICPNNSVLTGIASDFR